jgi:membrane-associated protein
MIEYLRTFVDLFLHIDKHLVELTALYGPWMYAILFVVVFCETGLVVTPFLPGDSLLFAAGAVAAVGDMNPLILIVLLIVAAIIGDTVNYHIGRFFGPKVFEREGGRSLINKAHLLRAQRFYEKYGAKTIVIARFVPIVRTFAPFVAGVAKMRYSVFVVYNIFGAIIWVVIFILAGYFFSALPVVKNNFSLVILGIIVISVLPAVYEVVRSRFEPVEAK